MNTQSVNNASLDEYQLKLKSESETLIKCQKSKNLESCFECETAIGCETRKKYVKAVYESMSHGQSGGFEF
jgi:hypothetical protein